MNTQITDAQIIEALGNPAGLAKILGLSRATIQAWKSAERGIPPKIKLAHPRLIAKGRKLALAATTGPLPAR